MPDYVSDFTLDELLDELQTPSKWNRARQIFRDQSARIEQLHQQRTPLDPVSARRLEFEAVKKILAIYGIVPIRGEI